MKLLPSLLAGLGLLLTAPVEAKAPKSAQPAMWVVKDADTTIYLFGTVHVLKPDVVWFDDEVKAAFDRSDELMLEVVEPGEAEMAGKIAKIGIDPDGPPLSEKLPPEVRERYKKAMADAGFAWQNFEMFRPWMAALNLTMTSLRKLGYSDGSGAEKILTDAARKADKSVSGLESVDEQLGMFAGLSEDHQIAFLIEGLKELPQAEKQFASLVSYWSRGKADALAKEMNESMPELADVLLYQRNARWAKEIAARMEKPGTVFIAVGAGHLAGPKSVQDDLKTMGISSARVRKKDLGLK